MSKANIHSKVRLSLREGDVKNNQGVLPPVVPVVLHHMELKVGRHTPVMVLYLLSKVRQLCSNIEHTRPLNELLEEQLVGHQATCATSREQAMYKLALGASAHVSIYTYVATACIHTVCRRSPWNLKCRHLLDSTYAS